MNLLNIDSQQSSGKNSSSTIVIVFLWNVMILSGVSDDITYSPNIYRERAKTVPLNYIYDEDPNCNSRAKTNSYKFAYHNDI
jgi:hypothetical protein